MQDGEKTSKKKKTIDPIFTSHHLCTKNEYKAPKLILDLKCAVQDMIYEASEGGKIFSDADVTVQSLCHCLEMIFSNGLKDINFFGKTTLWDFLSNVADIIPSTDEVVRKISKESKSPLAKGRIFFRMSLNENSSHMWTKALLSNKSLTEFV